MADRTGVPRWRVEPRLLVRDRQVTATTTSAVEPGRPAQLGPDGMVMDRPDDAPGGETVAAEARPEVTVHQMTAILGAHADRRGIKQPVTIDDPVTIDGPVEPMRKRQYPLVGEVPA
ncbi:hypothetical protein [Streptomyces sp. NPDC020362]|uniref:hypothetical protein n=1 Tax=unclassified Streptomyces TaxID=2593676 RepID=UPI0033EAE197